VKVNTSTDKYDVMAEINMIPFIDVALVLLIIFMVMTPFLVKEQIKINLPKTRSANTPVDNTLKPVQVNITSAGAIYVNGEAAQDDQLFATIQRLLREPATQPVLIAADKDVAFDRVVTAMDAAKRCGAKQLGISAMHDENITVKESAAPAPVKAAAKPSVKRGTGGTAKAPSTAAPKPSGQPRTKK
jgi:biopolymer transport protein ExbD